MNKYSEVIKITEKKRITISKLLCNMEVIEISGLLVKEIKEGVMEPLKDFEISVNYSPPNFNTLVNILNAIKEKRAVYLTDYKESDDLMQRIEISEVKK